MADMGTKEANKNPEEIEKSEESFFNKFRQAFLEQWRRSTMTKRIGIIMGPILVLALIISFFATDLSAKIFNAKEYKVYEYAIECVEDELRFPNTAKYPSFKDCSISKSVYSSQIIIDSYVDNSEKNMKYAWDVSGYGTCENAMGMTLNYSFTVTVVLSESGKFWCYKCDTSL